MEKLKFFTILVNEPTQEDIDFCKRENLPVLTGIEHTKVEGGEKAIAEKINEIIDFLDNLKI
jgi:hypothetical protein